MWGVSDADKHPVMSYKARDVHHHSSALHTGRKTAWIVFIVSKVIQQMLHIILCIIQVDRLPASHDIRWQHNKIMQQFLSAETQGFTNVEKYKFEYEYSS